ncbi:MAG: sugar ABC transporter permease [Firmicutes bacterium]|uniref:Sugar ABC transporter permease n=1 Tax=Candidatus Scatoplasma merdavium TaxID=2840932 RepID=A0A9D9GSI2_9BACL|nr:sugar ABC transporter permease [Candidatus Scatoplasma merdavium]
MIRATKGEIERVERNYWKRKGWEILYDWRLYVMLIPLFFFLICWKYLPIASMVMSFKDYNGNYGVYQSNWVGLYWFDTLMFRGVSISGTSFWMAFRNTFVLSFYGLVFGFPFPIILALLFSEIKCRPYRAVVQVLTYLPKFVSTVVVSSLVILLLRPANADNNISAGPLASVLDSLFGIKDNIMSDPHYFRSVYQISGIWETAGYGSIVYFAAILGISPTNYEAARMDGASKMQQIRYVTIPGMTTTLVIMLILEIGKLLTIGYEKVILLEGGNSPKTSLFVNSETISSWVWHLKKLGSINDSVGAAADMFNSVISMLLVIGSNQIAKKVSSTSLY